MTALAELIEVLRANADDEINRTEDNGAAAAAYRNALELVRSYGPRIESESVRRYARMTSRPRATGGG